MADKEMVEEVGETEKVEKEEKKTLRMWMEEHPKTVFITRAISWFTFAAILPFVFIAYRYGIFKNNSTIAITGGGIIAIIIVGIVTLALFNYLRQGMEGGFAKQCVTSFVKIIIPLMILLLLVQGIKKDIELFETSLGVVIACEFVAIPVNPFPEWLEKRKKEKKLEEQESIFGALWDKFFAKKQEEENKPAEPIAPVEGGNE